MLRCIRMFPGGHSGELDAILDDVVDLAVGQTLCLWRTEVRRLRVEVVTEWRDAGAVETVTTGAMREKVFAALFQAVRSRLQGILFPACACWNGPVAQIARDVSLK